MPLRRRLHRQLAVKAWDGDGMSPTNAVVCALILLNLGLQILETEPEVRAALGRWTTTAEWVLVSVFTVEFTARVWVAPEDPDFAGRAGRLRYMATPFALIDLFAILPAWLSLGALDSSVARSFRLLRVLRFGRFGAFSVAIGTIVEVVTARVYELTVSIGMAAILLLLASTAMYFVEGPTQPEAFGSIPRALWWGVVTMTTVGYGDATPQTPAGKVVAAVVTLLAVAIIAVPTGILAASFSEIVQKRKSRRGTRRGPPDAGDGGG